MSAAAFAQDQILPVLSLRTIAHRGRVHLIAQSAAGPLTLAFTPALALSGAQALTVTAWEAVDPATRSDARNLASAAAAGTPLAKPGGQLL